MAPAGPVVLVHLLGLCLPSVQLDQTGLPDPCLLWVLGILVCQFLAVPVSLATLVDLVVLCRPVALVDLVGHLTLVCRFRLVQAYPEVPPVLVDRQVQGLPGVLAFLTHLVALAFQAFLVFQFQADLLVRGVPAVQRGPCVQAIRVPRSPYPPLALAGQGVLEVLCAQALLSTLGRRVGPVHRVYQYREAQVVLEVRVDQLVPLAPLLRLDLDLQGDRAGQGRLVFLAVLAFQVFRFLLVPVVLAARAFQPAQEVRYRMVQVVLLGRVGQRGLGVQQAQVPPVGHPTLPGEW